MSRFVLTAIYHELSFDSRDVASCKSMISLEKLALSAETNPNLRFTSSFNYGGFTASNDDKNMRVLLPFLVNLQRMAIKSSHVDPETLGLIPPTVKLTHLILESTNYSSAFVKFVESQTHLHFLSVYHFELESEEHPYDAAISPTAIPEIRSLRCPISIAKLFGHRPSIISVCFTPEWDELPAQFHKEIMTMFPSVRAAHFALPLDFPEIALFSLRLSQLEYLRLDIGWRLAPSDWSVLAGTKLKYIRLLGHMMLIMDEPEEISRSIFNAVGTVVVVDLSEEEAKVRRFYRHSGTSVLVRIPVPRWQLWWETVETDIDEACLDHHHSVVT
ncbi:hypothetical protein EYR40_006113 [Pleurotus pulmonarius]|nr:hypothetical protein EYR36_010735 [Pleurotus pulmonarius]KAF4599025.1 hypothetical protein EYR40_006113 [Pleurotus pulmonarius]